MLKEQEMNDSGKSLRFVVEKWFAPTPAIPVRVTEFGRTSSNQRPDSGRLRPSHGSGGFALRAPPETPARQLRQRASPRHQPGLPDLTVIPTSRATAPIPIAIQVPAPPGHSAVSSLGICTTPARMLLWRAPMRTVKGRHPTNLNSSSTHCSGAASAASSRGGSDCLRFTKPPLPIGRPAQPCFPQAPA